MLCKIIQLIALMDFILLPGEFGVVYKGYLKSEMMNKVAIKTLKGIYT